MRQRHGTLVALVATMGLSGLWSGVAHAAWSNKTIYQFTDGFDGDQPGGGVNVDGSGNFYGATTFGGFEDSGTVFRVTPGGQETVLHSFCAADDKEGNCADGLYPEGGLVIDTAGAIQGMAEFGGAKDMGIIFKLTPSSGKGAWPLKVLHAFSGPDGGDPRGGLVADTKGVLYGTTYGGGRHGMGTVFRLVPSTSAAGSYTFASLYSFAGGADGANPFAGVILDSKGNIYGTTYLGAGGSCGNGLGSCGTVFQLSPPAAGKTVWVETILHKFRSTDGANPAADLVRTSSGVIYGTVSLGGADGSGGVFELTPPAKGKTAWVESVIHSFTGKADGGTPEGGVTLQGADLLGGTGGGGNSTSCGNVFKMAPPVAAKKTWTYTVLHDFTDGTDGCGVSGSVLLGTGGKIYGLTSGYDDSEFGGGVTPGTVFELTP